MSLNAVLALVPDRTHVQLILLDAESGFGLCELGIGFPELLIAPIGDVRAQEIGTLRKRGPVVECGVAGNGKAETCRAAVRLQRDCKASGSTLVLLQDAADLPVHRRWIEPFLRAADASGQAFERLFDPPAELVVHGPFFAAPIGRTAQDPGLAGLGVAGAPALGAVASRAPAVRASKFRDELLELRLRRADDVAPAGLAQPRQI